MSRLKDSAFKASAFQISTLLAGLLLGAPVSEARAEPQPVVVELFTSQGCSSCPPADALISELVDQPDILPLAFHVDYWDYLGWADRFANPEFSHRQQAYAHAAGERMVYTPQLIVQGQQRVAGAKAMKLAKLIDQHQDQPRPLSIVAERDGDKVHITAEAQTALPNPMVLRLVLYQPDADVTIKSGENAGLHLHYVNIVRDVHEVGAPWVVDEAPVIRQTITAPEPGPWALLIQDQHFGPIRGALRLP